jgi:hypothetical protein
MCTYNITVNDTLIEQARPAIGADTDIAQWIQHQVESLLIRLAVDPQHNAKTDTEPLAPGLETILASAVEHAGKATDDRITPGVSRLIRGNSWYISDEELDQMRYEYLMEKYK